MSWISVEYKMPEENKLCLVCDVDKWLYVAFLNDGTFLESITDNYIAGVEYWMYAPEKP